MRLSYPFSAIVGQEEMRRALLIAAVDASVGGVMVFGDRGTGKSTAARALAALLPPVAASAAGYQDGSPRKGKVAVPFVDLPLGATEDRVVWYDLVGLTISCDCHIAPLASTIAAMRNVSRNPRLCVMVGGRVLGLDPDLARRAGADGTARDARLALDVAADLVRVRQGEALVAG